MGNVYNTQLQERLRAYVATKRLVRPSGTPVTPPALPT